MTRYRYGYAVWPEYESRRRYRPLWQLFGIAAVVVLVFVVSMGTILRDLIASGREFGLCPASDISLSSKQGFLVSNAEGKANTSSAEIIKKLVAPSSNNSSHEENSAKAAASGSKQEDPANITKAAAPPTPQLEPLSSATITPSLTFKEGYARRKVTERGERQDTSSLNLSEQPKEVVRKRKKITTRKNRQPRENQFYYTADGRRIPIRQAYPAYGRQVSDGGFFARDRGFFGQNQPYYWGGYR